MIRFDEEALVCDLAETYHIYDYKQLPATMVAVFSCGLSDNSRIKMKLANEKVDIDTILLASISDSLRLLLWIKTDDGVKGINRPSSVLSTLTGQQVQEKNELVFSSGEDFEKERSRLLGGGNYGD